MRKGIPSQDRLLQFSISSVTPTQSAPPPDGGGLVQERERERCPTPHVAEQEDHVPHSDQSPSRTIKNKANIKVKEGCSNQEKREYKERRIDFSM